LRFALGDQRAAHVRSHLRDHASDRASTGDPIKGWEAGLTWVFIQSCRLMVGGFSGPWISKITPPVAPLCTLAVVYITFISMAPAVQMFTTPLIGIICFAIILLSWFGGVKYRGIPAGLVAIAAGTLIAWLSTAAGLNYGGMSIKGLAGRSGKFRLPRSDSGGGPCILRLRVSWCDSGYRHPLRHLATWSRRWTTWSAAGRRRIPDHPGVDR
jgi:hypothetical protein